MKRHLSAIGISVSLLACSALAAPPLVRVDKPKAPTDWALDDVMETFNHWTLLYALGGPESLIEQYRRIWEGRLIKFTIAKAPSTQMAKNGMYFKEFPVSFDWEHNAEGLAAFHFYTMDAPGERLHQERARRFAGFFMGEDPQAQNYDPKLKIIRSLHSGSR